MLNINWLNTFCVLVETKHFTKTAQRLYMTQAGVSQQIKKLENYLGIELIVREGKSFYLSDAGQTLYDKGKLLLSQIGILEESVRADDPFQGQVSLKTPGSVGLRLYSKLLQLQETHPGLIMDHRFAPNEEIVRDVVNNNIDIGLVTEKTRAPDVYFERLGNERLRLVTAKSVTSVSWETLKSLGFINHPDGAHHASLLLGANFAEFTDVNDFRCSGFSNQIGLILEPVIRELGFTVLPEYAIEQFPEKSQLSVHELAKPISEPLYAVLKRNKSLSARCQMVLEEMKRWL